MGTFESSMGPPQRVPPAGHPVRHHASKPSPRAGEAANAAGDDVAKPSEELLQHLADQAMQYPPKDIHVLAASVQKFLLTNLEPALQMAREIRQELSQPGEHAVEVLADDRQYQAMTLLAG